MPSLDSSVLEAAVCTTVVNVFESILNTSPEPGIDNVPDSVELVTAALHFSGGWAGATLLELPPELATVFTSRMLGMDPPDSVNDEVIDAMGELVNMIGGNLKCILPPGVALSLPSVVVGTDYSVRICGGNLVKRWTFLSEFGPFWVSIIEVKHHQSGELAVTVTAATS
jgi:chemotaxis protein CheX